MRVPHTRLWQGDASGGDALIRDFLVADVFTDTPLEGNQLGIFPDGRGLSDELMLKATREMNFSETVFFVPPEHDGADARVRTSPRAARSRSPGIRRSALPGCSARSSASRP